MIEKLSAESPLERAQAFMELAHEHDHKVGDAMVSAFLAEKDLYLFTHISEFVLPRWMSLLATNLEASKDWPLDDERTRVILLAPHGLQLKPVEPYLTKWLNCDNLGLRLAALHYASGAGLFEEEAWASLERLQHEIAENPGLMTEVERAISHSAEQHPGRFLKNLDALLNPEATDQSFELVD